MALETLKGVEEIGGFKVERVEWNQPANHFIEINDAHNAITFKIQSGPVKENGVNGCQVDTIIHTALIMVRELNKKAPCQENKLALYNLISALAWLDQRTRNRQLRGVEGTSQA